MLNSFVISTGFYNSNFLKEKQVIINNRFTFFSDKTFHQTKTLQLIIDGYILPRNDIFDKYKNYNQHELVLKLYDEFGDKFIHKIKGIFCVIILKDDTVHLYTDHFGLYKVFIYSNGSDYIISNSINNFKKFGISLIPDEVSICIKGLLKKNIGSNTSFKKIEQTQAAAKIIISDNVIISQYWDYSVLIRSHVDLKIDYYEFVDLILTNFGNLIEFLKPQKHTITLTGGKDSRTGLSALIHLGIKPEGFTYGNNKSRDAIYASKLSKTARIDHYIFSPITSDDWFLSTTKKIIDTGNPEISLHRAHRYFAFDQMRRITGENTIYYAGYLAGEFLMGLYYDDLIFPKFLTNFWDSGSVSSNETRALLSNNYIKGSSVDINQLTETINKLSCFDSKLSKQEQQFYGLFELGVPHHGQDIFLAGLFFEYVYPFFLDIDFLELLFRSRFSFLYKNNKSKNLLTRYELYNFNLNIQHILCPEIDIVPFGKRGSYNTKEYLRGRIYWSLVKSARYFMQSQKYPPSFSYDQSYRNYLLNILMQLQNDKTNVLNLYFDTDKAIKEIKEIKGKNQESELHKYSNIVQLYLQLRKSQNI